MRYIFSLFLFALLTINAHAAERSGNSVAYSVGDQPYEGYLISPAADAPLVLLIHDWDGLGDYEVHRARMLAELGYAVFAADLFGAGVRPTAVEDKRAQTSALYADRAKMRALLDGALAAAKEQGLNTDRAVAMGYCFGGAAVLEFGRSGAPLKGFVSFHGGLETPEGQDYGSAKGSFLILHGTADSSVTMDHFASLAKELEAQNVPHEMISYSGAPHAFTVFGSQAYREDADKKSWNRFVEYLGETL